METSPKNHRINWIEISIFYVIAVAVSAPFRLGLIHPEEIFPLPAGLSIFYSVLRGIGPAVGFLVVVYLLRSKVSRQFSFWGISKIASLIAASVIPICLIIFGGTQEGDLNPHYKGFLYGVMLLAYSLGEEYGWRGYLQEALAPMKMIPKILLIAVLWYIWHLNFLRTGISLEVHLIHFVSLVAGSWGLLKITETTKSILFAAAVHLSFNILADSGHPQALIIIAISAVVWTILVRYLIGRRK